MTQMKIALIQLNASDNKEKNLDRALHLTFEAIREKAEFILLPEVFNYRGNVHSKKGYAAVAEQIPGPSTIPFMIFARAHKVFILAGSLYEKTKGTRQKVFNTSVLIDDQGKIVAKYRKIHLFDARLKKKSIDESKYLLAGKSIKTADVKGFKVGLSICYDLRFPEFYEKYRRAGVDILTVPSSFTKSTGQAHWETLLRARAIENLCYVLAPNQFGRSKSGIATYGHSLVVGPWGEVVAEGASHKEEIVYTALDRRKIFDAHRILPGIIG